jgi:ketosteroid isomerase-like protein
MGESSAVDLVRRCYEAFNRQDIEALLELLDPEVEWSTRREVPDEETYRGHGGARRRIQTLTGTFEEFAMEPLEYTERGDRVLVRVRQHGRGRASGVFVEKELTHMHTLRGGRVVRIETL